MAQTAGVLVVLTTMRNGSCFMESTSPDDSRRGNAGPGTACEVIRRKMEGSPGNVKWCISDEKNWAPLNHEMTAHKRSPKKVGGRKSSTMQIILSSLEAYNLKNEVGQRNGIGRVVEKKTEVPQQSSPRPARTVSSQL